MLNSGRWAQWHWKGCDQPGEALPDVEILSMIREEMHHLYQKEGGRGIESFEAMTWNYAQPAFTKFCRISERIEWLRTC